MAYENLKAAIKQAIKQNGNQEITGDLLQATLLSIVDNLGNKQSDITAELAKKFDKESVVQETGNAAEKVMSQKAVTDVIDDKLSKSQGGEIKKPIVITNDSSDYSITINPEASIYVWSKVLNKNIFEAKFESSVTMINVGGNPLSIHNIRDLNSRHGEIYNAEYNPGTGRYEDVFYANFFKRRGGTGNQILLDDGSTTSSLITRLDTTNRNNNMFWLTSTYFDGSKVSSVCFDGATKKLAGLMTAADKVKLDGIENTYLPLSGGTLTGTLRLNDLNSDENGLNINNVNGIQSVDQDKVSTPEVWTTDGSSIPIDKAGGVPTLNQEGELDGYISSQDGNVYSTYDGNNGNTILNVTGNYDEEGSGGRIILKSTEDSKGKISVMLDGVDGSVNAETFKAIHDQNKNEVWCTDGSRLNILNLLSNVAIYVVGKFAIAESGIDNTTVIDSPDSIIFDSTLLGGRFFARKGLICYTHWKADISKNIAPPSRYGIETEVGVFPFNNQLYKFSELDGLYTATCSNSGCSMTKLTIK